MLQLLWFNPLRKLETYRELGVKSEILISIHNIGSISSFCHPWKILKVQQLMRLQAPASSPSQDAEVLTQQHGASTVSLQYNKKRDKFTWEDGKMVLEGWYIHFY